MALRDFAGAAKRTTLTGDITSTATTINVVDASGYPSAATGPFSISLDLGLAGEEKVLISARSGNTLTVAASGRGYDGTSASSHNNGAGVDHVLTAIDMREANAHVNDTTGDPHPQYLTPAEGAVLYPALGHTHTSTTITKTVRIPHTFTISGDVLVASGDTSFIPGFFVAAPAGQTMKVVAARHRINSGTSATVSVQVNGVAATGFSALAVSTTTVTTDPADVTLADGDLLALVVSAVAGAPRNMSFTLWLESVV